MRTEDEFCHLHEAFLAKHCHHFEDCEENKHVYMDVFRSYVRAPSAHTAHAHAHTHTTLPLSSCTQTDIVEKYIESQLLERVPGFTMAAFQLSLK